MTANDEVICIGGFGIDEKNCHTRLEDVVILSYNVHTCSIRKMLTKGDGPGNNNYYFTFLLSSIYYYFIAQVASCIIQLLFFQITL